MKAAPFGYLAPENRQEILEALRRYGPEAKLLAGGQSLVPLLAMRLARPAVLIDLNRTADLAYVKPARGGVAIGAMTRQRTVEHDSLIEKRVPLLCDAIRWVGHPQIRNRGTVGGSLAHADPAAELPAVASVLGAMFALASTRGERTVDAARFFTGYLSTALEPDELLVEVRFRAMPAGAGWAFTELARRHGDFALVGVAVVVQGDGEGRCGEARMAFTGISHGPLRLAEVEQSLVGKRLTTAAAEDAGRLASSMLDPEGDIHATARYRRHVAGVLAARAIMEAAQRMQVVA